MDTYRGQFSEHAGSAPLDLDEESHDSPPEPPPAAIGQDERRMQVRAYNFWASLLGDRNFPSIEDLDPGALPDFGPHSVLLDFTAGMENPTIQFLGATLAEECGAEDPIATLADVPSRSLLSRITDHYMQILANQAPIGFEAEFVNQRERTVLYRGILLPFSSDDDTIDFIYGVINWKELADQQATDALLREIDQALAEQAARKTVPAAEPLAQWADGPADTHDDALDLGAFVSDEPGLDLPSPAFARLADDLGEGMDGLSAPADPDPESMALADWLASARALAALAHGAEDRTRSALYAAIGRAHDFALAASAAPAEFADMVAEAGLTMQVRAPLTPLVKLVFGADYDKTRLTEYASALAHAQRLGLPRGALAGFLASVPGGLKGVVAEERRHRRAASGTAAAAPRTGLRERLARQLRRLEPRALDGTPASASEFALAITRRLETGEVVVLGAIADDTALLERAARRLIG